jgi:D-sedoheptulose 7-phosphate isomerase
LGAIDERIRGQALESAELKKAVAELAPVIEEAATAVIDALIKGNRVYTFGNGGSAADAEHFACELAGRFRLDRPAYRVEALTTNAPTLTAIANDYGFDKVFVRQITGRVEKGDVAIGFSTSGKSPNVVEAMRAAKDEGLTVIGLTGADECPMDALSTILIKIPSKDTPRVQEGQMLVVHILCDIVEAEIERRRESGK